MNAPLKTMDGSGDIAAMLHAMGAWAHGNKNGAVQLMNEAAAKIDESAPHGEEMAGIVAALRTEFAGELHSMETGENQSMRVESVYTRMTGISACSSG